MTNRLGEAISPYLRSHAGNPVDWYPWGEEAFAVARDRDVPVLVSIGYSTCHWCHVMARESFSDPVLAARLNAGFVAVKVDREEHPEVDAVYLAAAGAFTQNLGWPLNVFTTPGGKAFFAGTYSPPVPLEGHPSFGQLLDAVSEAWTVRRTEVESIATELAAAIADATAAPAAPGPASGAVEGVVLPDAGGVRSPGLTAEALATVVSELEEYEDRQFGGFGGAPKFPVAPVLGFLLEAGTQDAAAAALALRTLEAMAACDLRDPVEGGFFRYATRRDWSEPHYERMLYDNALLLDAYARAWAISNAPWARAAAEGIAGFLIGVMQLPSGAFASAQDSESTVDGDRVEGGYYELDADARARQTPPALDEKVLTGWNGLAIGALARASLIFDRPAWAGAAQHAADYLLSAHVDGDRLVRASVGERRSVAVATLEDHGMLAEGLLALAAVTGSARYAVAGRMLVDAVLPPAPVRGGEDVSGRLGESRSPGASGVPGALGFSGSADAAGAAGAADATGAADAARAADASRASGATPRPVFAVPGGGDPVLQVRGLSMAQDPSEGAYPSGVSACASAALLLHALTADDRYRAAAAGALEPLAPLAVTRAISFGTTLALLTRLGRPAQQLVLVEPDAPPRADDPEAATRVEPDALPRADDPEAAMRVEPDALPRADDPEAAVLVEPDALPRADDPEAAVLVEPDALPRADDPDAAVLVEPDALPRADDPEAAVLVEPDALPRADDPEAAMLVEPDAPPRADDPEAAMRVEPDALPRADDPEAAMRAEGLRAAVRMWPGGATLARATEVEARMLAEAGFELFAGRVASGAQPTAYLCTDFVCRLPATTAEALRP